MADIKISQLTGAAAASGTQEFEVNDSGTSKKVTGAQIKAFAKDGLVVSDVTDLTATAAELNYVDGVTSNIQTQLDGKLTSFSLETYTGDVDIDGELIVSSYNETYQAVSSSSNATTINCEAGNVFSHTLSENTTFTFSNPPASGTAYGFSLKITQDASASGYTVTWPTSVDWPASDKYAASGAPQLTSTASAEDQFVFYTYNGGTTWYGFVVGLNLG